MSYISDYVILDQFILALCPFGWLRWNDHNSSSSVECICDRENVLKIEATSFSCQSCKKYLACWIIEPLADEQLFYDVAAYLSEPAGPSQH